MQINVQLFGPMAQHVGRPTVELKFEGDAVTVDIIRAELSRTEPSLAGDLDACRIAVNHSFAHNHTPVNQSDEVAVIGFVSGG